MYSVWNRKTEVGVEFSQSSKICLGSTADVGDVMVEQIDSRSLKHVFTNTHRVKH